MLKGKGRRLRQSRGTDELHATGADAHIRASRAPQDLRLRLRVGFVRQGFDGNARDPAPPGVTGGVLEGIFGKGNGGAK